MRTIEPCPFCGRDVKLLESNGWHWIECECGMSTDWEPDEDRLVAMWNRRIKPEQKKGKWEVQPSIDDDRPFIWWKCSVCGQIIYSETERDRREFHAFCGRCGADMRGE